MSSFYGNMKNNSRASFIFDKIYPSRKAMEEALYVKNPDDGRVIGDGIFVNRYVLVNYAYTFYEPDNDAGNLYDKVDNKNVNFDNYSAYYVKVDGQYQKATNADASQEFYQKRIFVDKYYHSYDQQEQISSIISDDSGEEPETIEYELKNGSYKPNEIYWRHYMDDQEQYHAVYDRTVWMKIYIDGQERYIMVSQLDAKAPLLTAIADAPSCGNKEPHFDMPQSNDYDYLYYVPKNWDVVLNTYDPNNNDFTDSEPEYYYYEKDLANNKKTFHTDLQYPYFNQAGFNNRIQTRVEDTESDGIKFIDVPSGALYPVHKMMHIELTRDTYFPNRFYKVKTKGSQTATGDFDIEKAYYVLKNGNKTFVPLVFYKKDINHPNDATDNKYFPVNYSTEITYYCDDNFNLDNFEKATDEPFDPNVIYYELTWATEKDSNEKNVRQTSMQKDTKRVDVYLPSLGNAVSDFYDALYGEPRYINGQNLLGYATSDQLNSYPNSGEGLECWGPNGKNNPELILSEDDIDALSPEMYPGLYDIPIYTDGNNRYRPYTPNQLLNALTPPYDNLGDEDNISVGWGITLLKRYLSELRYLSRGPITDGEGNVISYGLQSDWNSDLSDAFGYIHNKPIVIYTFKRCVLGNNENYDVDVENKYFIKDTVTDTGDLTFKPIKIKSSKAANNGNVTIQIGTVQANGTISYAASTTKNQNEIFVAPDYNGEEINRVIYSFEKVTGNFDANETYYQRQNEESNLYTKAQYYEGSTTTLNEENVDLNTEDLTFGYTYRITVNDQDEITKREYFLHASSEVDNEGKSIYLIYKDKFIKDFWLISENGNINEIEESLFNLDQNNNPIEEEASLTKAAMLAILNQGEIDLTDEDNTYYNVSASLSEDRTADFSYGQIIITNNYSDINASNFANAKDSLYIKVQTSGDPTQYEIHMIWNDAKGTPGQV